MKIKKSSLEQKWYYRVAKVFFLVLPILILLLLLLNRKTTICIIPQLSVPDFFQKYLIYILVGSALYYLIINIIWRGFLYIVFGGLEDDIKKVEQSKQNIQTTTETTKSVRGGENRKMSIGRFILPIIGVGFVLWALWTLIGGGTFIGGGKVRNCIGSIFPGNYPECSDCDKAFEQTTLNGKSMGNCTVGNVSGDTCQIIDCKK